MARTGSSAYLQYGYESSYGGGATQTKAFGCETKLTGLRYANNIIPVKELYTPEIKAFAHGKNEGAATIEWIVSNPWFWNFIFANPETTGASPYTHEWSSDPDWVGSGAFDNTDVRNYTTGHIEIGFEGEVANEVRNAKGVIAPSLVLRTTVNETVKASMPLIWSAEDVIGTTLDTSVAGDDIQFPYTFVHASLELPNGSAIAQIQDFELTFSPEGEQIWGLSSADAVATSGKKVINMTGRFRAGKVDSSNLAKVVARTEEATLEVILTNGLSSTDERSITLLFTGVGVAEHTSDVVPGEIVFENLTFNMRSVKVTAVNNTSSPP